MRGWGYLMVLPQLVSEEGFLRERSSHYRLIVANWMLDAWHFVDACFGAVRIPTRCFSGCMRIE